MNGIKERCLIVKGTLTLLLTFLLIPLTPLQLATNSPPMAVNIIIIWHFHQPWYYSSSGGYFLLPWVRMHCVGNYYKMALILSKYPDVHVTFTFSGSLLEQILDYVNRGLSDYRERISLKLAKGAKLTIEELFDMLRIPGGFFDINWERIVNVIPRYKALREKALESLRKYSSLPSSELKVAVVRSFSKQDFLDLATLFNLFWIDPQVIEEEYPSLLKLRRRALEDPNVHFSPADLLSVLKVHRAIMKEVLPAYLKLLRRGQVEIIPVPYSHPIAPILADLGWLDDLSLHLIKSLNLFQRVFNTRPRGLWPAEEAVNEVALNVISSYGFNWVVTDENLLQMAGLKDLRDAVGRAWYLNFKDKRLYVFFRNTDLSNRISFRYSKWDAKRAVKDLLSSVISLGRGKGRGFIIVIALDGENPWEHYRRFGDLFLNTLYAELSKLQRRGVIRTLTPSEYLRKYGYLAKELPLRYYKYLDLRAVDISNIKGYDKLPRREVRARIGESSWAGLSSGLSPWIGDRQENAAWMWLKLARETLLKTLNVTNVLEALRKNPKAVECLLRAEASDWFWWYGEEFGSPATFDPLFKGYLRGLYVHLGLRPPDYLYATFYPDGSPVGVLNPMPPSPLKEPPELDGKAERSEVLDSCRAPIGGKYFLEAYLGVYGSGIYIAVKPTSKRYLSDKTLALAIYFWTYRRSVSPYRLGYNVHPKYFKSDLGMALAYRAYVTPCNSTALIYVTNGKGDWIKLAKLRLYVSEEVELVVPYEVMKLKGGDLVYVTLAVYKERNLSGTTTRLGRVYWLRIPTALALRGGKVIFSLRDPIGDDDGPGTYKYPTNEVFKEGVFDLTKFRVVEAKDRLIFEVYVRKLGDNPWRGPNGFCLQYVQIYVRTTSNIRGSTNTYGLNVRIAPEYAWHFALLLAPGWGSEPVPKGERAAIYYSNGTVIAQNDLFKVYGDPYRKAIIAEVSKVLLPDVTNVDKWKYVVALTSYDGYGPGRIRPFGVKAEEWVVGTGVKYALAVAAGVMPRVMDLLYPTVEGQYRVLNSFKVNLATLTGTPANIRGVG